jgi:Sulfotransferase family
MNDATHAPGQLDASAIIAAARKSTGLLDLGEPDLRHGLDVLLRALDQEARLSATGIENQRAGLVGQLVNRLRITDTFRRHPEIRDEVIRGPIIIIGLPRSGTTKLQRMMAAGHDLQTLPLWRILNPAPLPSEIDDRVALAGQVAAAMREHFPDFIAGHPMDSREADEEVFMADLVMRGFNPCYVAHTPSYDRWLMQQDFGIWYDYLRRLLQMFQWQDGSPSAYWLLKTCEHLPWIDDLARFFPAATIVHCHRDPLTSIASIAALTTASRRMHSDRVDPLEVGRWCLDHWASHMQRYLQKRPALEHTLRFVDVAYREITDDAIPAIERILGVAGIECSSTARAAMRQWEADNPPGKHGQHRYDLPTYGLNADEIRAAFADYRRRFAAFI